MEAFLTEVQSISLIQWSASFLALVYVYFAYKNQAICFLFGLLSAVLWAYESYVNLNLKFDGALQIFYAFMSIYGWYQWQYGGDQKSEKPIAFLSAQSRLLWFVLGSILTLAIYYLTLNYIETSRGFLDILTTVFSIIATFLLAHRYIENWLIFIVVDILYIYIYVLQGGHVFALMMLLYTVMAVASWFSWKRIYKEAL